jgi:hypothetical protein
MEGRRTSNMPDIDKIIRYEQGEMDEQEVVTFFQDLIDSGLAWELQGHYGRTAQRFLDAGLCGPSE